MGVFDFMKEAGSKVLGGLSARKPRGAKKAAEGARARAESSPTAQKARAAAAEAKKKATSARAAADRKRSGARDAFNDRRAEARKTDELEDYLEKLELGGDVQIRFEDGTVSLSGSVPDQPTLERVVLAMGNVDGVERVAEDLHVGAPADAARMYTVQAGDTLSAIAYEFYGDSNRYSDIFDANQPMLSDPLMIYPGQVIRIPL